MSARLVYTEARAALAQAARLGRLTARGLRRARGDLETIYAALDRVEIDEVLVRHAGDLAETYALRGYDAVHLAAAIRLSSRDLVMIAGDADLLAAASAEQMAVAQVTHH